MAPSPSSTPNSSPGASAIVRYATEADVPVILSLIHALADYERATSSVKATEASLLSTLSFPSNPKSGYARTILIYPSSDNHAPNPSSGSPSSGGSTDAPACVGFALFFYTYSTWRAAPGIYLEDLFVLPENRGQGYGKRLLAELAKELQRINGKRLEWSVLTWNEPSIRFYEGIGATKTEAWVGMRMEDGDGGHLEKLAAEGKGVVGGFDVQ